MRTITTNVFSFDELNEQAQKKAIDDNRSEIGGVLCDFDADEYRGTLAEIEKIFDIKVYDWCVGYPGTYCRWRFTDSRWDEMSDEPRFLPRYLNEVERYCRKGKYYSTGFKQVPKDKEHPAGLSYQKRRSKVMFDRICPLTGCWCDYAVEEYTGDKRWDYVRDGKTIEDFLQDMLDAFFDQWNRDSEMNYADERISDHIIGNDYEFMEDGRRYVA